MTSKNQVVLVTGANRGIGRAIAAAFVENGATVYAGARDPSKVDLPGVIPIAIDITDAASVVAAALAAPDVNVVVNNAGILQRGAALGEGSLERFKAQFDTNFYGTWQVASAFADVLKKNGGGTIVNVLSVLSWLTMEGSTGYSASKAAAWALTNGLRKELAGQGTKVIGLHVGYVDTDMAAGVDLPKSNPADVAAQVVAAVESGQVEILADEISRQVKASFAGVGAAYL